MLLAKLPTPVPSVVLLSEMVGFCVFAQQTPREVIAAPPSESNSVVTTIEVADREDTAGVAIEGPKIGVS